MSALPHIEEVPNEFFTKVLENSTVPPQELSPGEYKFIFTEGPVYDKHRKSLFFSDIIGNTRYKWSSEKEEMEVVQQPSHKGNGMTIDREGNLVVCLHAKSAVVRFEGRKTVKGEEGREVVLCDRFEGKELNSPNDIVIKSDGSMFFTDPPYGRMFDTFGVERPLLQGFSGLFYLPPSHIPGEEPLLAAPRETFSKPNGLCFSPDESKLYVNDTEQFNIRVFDILPDGTLGPNRIFAEGIIDEGGLEGKPDGMKCDKEGRVYVTAPGGVWVYSPEGTLLGRIRTPKKCANLHWGGENFSTLFLTCTSSVYSLQTVTSGRMESFMTSLPKSRLGKTDLLVTRVSLGGVGIGGAATDELYGGISDDEAVKTIHRAIERGINFIDTSPLYKESERRIGLALEALPEKKRSHLVISTKVGDECPPYSNNGGHRAFSREGVLASVQHSLKQLRVVKCLDIVFIHDPTLEEIDEFFAPGGGVEAIKELQEQGVIRHLGLGCQEHDAHAKFMKLAGSLGSVILTVNDHNLLRRTVAKTSWIEAHEREMGILNAGVFYMGLLADPINSWKMGFKKNLDRRQLCEIACDMGKWCEERGVSLRTMAIQFGLDHPSVTTIPIGCRTVAEVDQVVDDVLHPVSDDVYQAFMKKFDSIVGDLGKDTANHWYYKKDANAL